ncbi:MAG: SH3 domain-containing protein [Promethearchaeota archaeon]
MKYCKVISDYRSPYTKPLKIRKREILQIGDKESEWPGWVWCMNKDGRERWVPRSFIDIQGNSGVMLQDYEANELTVLIGEELKIEKEESGWVWVENKEGKKGWIPLDNIKIK